MKIDTIKTSFVGGEWASALFGRTDVAQYENACAIMENFLIRPYGSALSTPGTEYINATKTGGSTGISRLLNFVFSRTDAFVIEMGVGYFRFYNNGAVVVSPGTTPYEVVHTYTAAELFDVQFVQLNDVIYLTHKDHAPAKLTRISSTSWTLANLAFTGGPYLPDNTTSTTITVSATAGSVTLSATGNIFTASSSATVLGHVNTFWKINTTVTDSTTGLTVQGYVQVTAITNPSTATATIIKPLKAITATTIWAEGSWSSVRGWPARVTFHQQRLCFARTTYQPQNIWCSQSFIYENFAVNGGADDDAIDIQLASAEANQINWLASGDSLIAGTYGGEFAIKSGDDSPLTPANTNAFKQTSWGSEAVPPKRIGNFFYYIQRFSRKIRELFYFWDTNSYKSVDKTIFSPHISGNGFVEFAYQQNPDTVLWAICSNGTIATMTREIDQEVQGWSRQTTDGYYESITSIPSYSEPYDEIWVVVRRNINSSDVRYIERFKSQIVPDRQDKAFYVHAGLSYDAYNATTTPTSTALSFSFPTAATKLLLHCDGTDGDNAFSDASGSKTVLVTGSTQISTAQKVFGSGSAYFQNVFGIDSYTKLLLHLDNSVVDSSGSSHAMTNNSITFSTSIYKFGGYSGQFSGTSQYVYTADSSDWNLGSGDYTVDFWVNSTNWNNVLGGGVIFQQGTDANNYQCLFMDGNLIRYLVKTSGVFTVNYQPTAVLSLNNWYHIALVRNGAVLTVYVNGVALTAGSSGTISDYSGPLYIGHEPGYVNSLPDFTGNIDEFRWSVGIARWTANFNPSSIAYTSIPDCLAVADSSDWALGTGNFTMHQRVRFLDVTNSQVIMGQYADANNFWYLKKGTNSAGNKLQMYFRSGSADKANYIMSSSSSLTINQWYHVSAVRSSSTLSIYIDGASQPLTATVPISTNDVGDVSAPLIIGQQNNAEVFSGYLDEIVFIKGTALWTTNFTPPVDPSTQSGTVALVTTSAAYFSAGMVGKRIRTINASGVVDGEMTISGYTSSTIVVGVLSQDFSAFTYAAGLWGVSVQTISGLSHLNSETVSILGDGVRDTPNKTVTGGAITLSTDYFYVTVGKPYTQKIKTLAQEAGSQRGTSQGKIQRINQVSLKVNNSYDGFMIGDSEDNLDTLVQASPSLYSGTIANINFKGDYAYGAQVVIENPDPLPIELLNIITTIDTNDK